MQEYKKPLFQKGRVLKKEGLELLRDFPYEFARLWLKDCSDGILFGFDISYGKEEGKEGQIVVGAGAAWHEGQIVLTEQETFPFALFDHPVKIWLRFLPNQITEDFFVCPLEISLENQEQEKEGMELGRFRLSKGARLRKDYRDLQDFSTAYNTLDVTHVPYAGTDGITVSPVLLQVFARMILENPSARETDVNFAFLCLNASPVSRKCLLWYISRRLGTPYRELSHSEIYQCLVQIAGTGSRSIQEKRRKEGPAVF